MPQPSEPKLYLDVPSEWSDFFPIYDEAVATAPYGSMLVEVGSFWGKSAIYLAEAARNANKALQVYCVDPWAASPQNNPGMFDQAHGEAGHIEPRIHAAHNNSLFETFAHYVERTRDPATGRGLSPDPLRIMRMESLEAARFFRHMPNVHFVFLDGDHEYEYVKKELKAWEPILNVGGIIAGHDWTTEFWGVEKAVTEYFAAGVPKVECGRSWVVRLW